MYETQLQPFCVLQYKMLFQGCMEACFLLDTLTSASLLCSLDKQSSFEKTCSFLIRVLLPPRGIRQNHYEMLHDLCQSLTRPSGMDVGCTEGSRWISSKRLDLSAALRSLLRGISEPSAAFLVHGVSVSLYSFSCPIYFLVDKDSSYCPY